MKHRLLVPAAAGAAVLASFAFGAPAMAASTPTAVSAAPSATLTRATATAPINQTIAGLGTFAGTFTPTGFTSQNGQLMANGVVNGTLTSATGQVLQTVTNQLVSLPVTGGSSSAACNVLSLQLGPLHLNLLGLVVDLNQVNLNITAQPGSGDLLGNLLCSVTHLLDGSGTGGLATLLNRLLGL